MHNLSEQQQAHLEFCESITDKVKLVQQKCDLNIVRLQKSKFISSDKDDIIADYEKIKSMMSAIRDKVKASLVGIAHVYNEEGE